jgi:predicted dehydrogenase
MTWSHPRWHQIRDLVRAGKIGRPTAVQGRFSFFTRDPGNIRNQSALGGGALLDLGMYLVSSARFLLEAEPKRTSALIDIDPDFGTDRYCSFLLDFPGVQGSFVCSNQMGYAQRMIIYGTHGHIDIDTPWTPSPDAPTRFIVNAAASDGGPLVEEIVSVPATDQYTRQMQAFAETVAGKRQPAVPFASSIANMRVLDAIRAAGLSGSWQTI